MPALAQKCYRTVHPTRRFLHLLEIGAVIVSLVLAYMIFRCNGDETFNVVATGLGTAGLVVWIAVQDLVTLTIADSSLLLLACLAFADRLSAGDWFGSIGLDGMLTGSLMLGFREAYYRLKGFDGLGLGDVKLAAAGACLTGIPAFSWALFVASVSAIGFVFVHRLFAVCFRREIVTVNDLERLAFGAFLAPAIWAMWLLRHMPLPPLFANP